MAALKDPEFLKEAAKANLEIRPQSGAQLTALSKQVTATPRDVLAKTAKILGW